MTRVGQSITMSTIAEFLKAASDGDEQQVQAWINDGIFGVDAADGNGETALMNAARSGHMKVIRYLVEKKNANIHLRFTDKGDGWNALMFSAYYGMKQVVRYLIEHGADPLQTNSEGKTVYDLDPCMNCTKDDIAQEIAAGLRSKPEDNDKGGKTYGVLNNSNATENADLVADILSNKFSSSSSESSGEEDQTRIKMVEMYASICKEFSQEPNEMILEALFPRSARSNDFSNTLMLGCRNSAKKLSDAAVLPLLEVFNHAFQNTFFVVIDLSYAGIGNAATKSIATYLSASRTIVDLNLEGNNVGQIGGEALGTALKQQPSLVRLNVSHNPIGDTGVSKIADSLVDNRTLTELNLNNTQTGVLALTKIAAALNRNCPLISLRLDSPILYTIQEETTIRLAKALPYNTNLVALSLAHGGIKDHGTAWLAEHLEQNATLTELNLACNKITTTGVADLAKALQNRAVPCLINLDGNNLREQLLDEIDEVILEDNGQLKLCNVEYHTNEWPSDSTAPFLQDQRHWLVSRVANEMWQSQGGYQ